MEDSGNGAANDAEGPGKQVGGIPTDDPVSRRARQRALMIAVDRSREGNLDEMRELLRTAGVVTAGEIIQRRSEPDPDRYFGQGKLEQAKAEIERTGANLVACDDELAPRQERNL